MTSFTQNEIQEIRSFIGDETNPNSSLNDYAGAYAKIDEILDNYVGADSELLAVQLWFRGANQPNEGVGFARC
ncbi:MAG: hypothetical protein RIF37_06300 [Rhodospirillaceae bacterium]